MSDVDTQAMASETGSIPHDEQSQETRYEVLSLLGRGGMAEVWKTRMHGASGFEKLIALKRLGCKSTGSVGDVHLFTQEARMVARLTHPDIVQVYDFGVADDGQYFIAMEYVDGMSLGDLLKALRNLGTKLPLESVFVIGMRIARALAYAHAGDGADRLGVVHRDVSPQNILLSTHGEVKLSDFGIAGHLEVDGRNRDEVVWGKIPYMSPEQARGGVIDGRSDLFSLGLVLYEALVGKPMFPFDLRPETIARVTCFQQPDPFTIAQLPPDARQVIRRLLDPRPEGRHYDGYLAGQEMEDALGPGGIPYGERQLVGWIQTIRTAALQGAEATEELAAAYALGTRASRTAPLTPTG